MRYRFLLPLDQSAALLRSLVICSLVAIVLVPENIVDIEDVVAILVVIPIVLDTLARLRQNSSRVS